MEVSVSLLNRPAGWIWDADQPTAPFEKAIDPEGASRSREEYVARLYGAFCDSGMPPRPHARRARRVRIAAGRAWQAVAPHFGLAVDGTVRARMQAAAGMNSKAPIGRPEKFAGDGADKQAAASEELRRMIDAYARPALVRLKSLHAGEHA